MSNPVNLNLDNVSIEGCNYAIYKGTDYNCLTFQHPQDLSTWTACGEIRNNYLHLGGELLAPFRFPPLVYGQVTQNNETVVNRTIISPILNASDTITLPVTRELKPGDRPFVGRNVFVYDIKLESPTGVVIPLVYGFVQVLPDVSGCLSPYLQTP